VQTISLIAAKTNILPFSTWLLVVARCRRIRLVSVKVFLALTWSQPCNICSFWLTEYVLLCTISRGTEANLDIRHQTREFRSAVEIYLSSLERCFLEII